MNIYHINEETGRVNICRAKPGNCPLGSRDSHFESKNDALKYNELRLSKELKPFRSFKKVSNGSKVTRGTSDLESKEFKIENLAHDLRVISDVKLRSLVKKALRRQLTLKEAESELEKYGDSTPFYVYFNGNQEMTLRYDDAITRNTFLKGACGFIASEVSRVTNKPIVLFSRETNGDYWEGHVAVKLDDGTYFDIDGNKSLSSFRSEFAGFSQWSERVVSQEEFEKTMRVENDFVNKRLDPLERAALAKICFDLISDYQHLFTQND